jgi:hypothetical protein
VDLLKREGGRGGDGEAYVDDGKGETGRCPWLSVRTRRGQQGERGEERVEQTDATWAVRGVRGPCPRANRPEATRNRMCVLSRRLPRAPRIALGALRVRAGAAAAGMAERRVHRRVVA